MMSAPRDLLDPDGEGIYTLSECFLPALRAASFFGVHYRDLDRETVWMRPPAKGTDEWRPIDPASWTFSLLYLLPGRFRPVAYAYFTPKPEAL
jgi:hypothetical protein